MRRPFPPLTRVKSLSVMPTYKCNAACRHCGTCSSPYDKTFLDVDLMLKGINEAISCGYRVVVFTGGEATLAEDALLRGLRLASSRGVCTRLVTNGSWATDEIAADSMIAKLLEAGLVEINFSTGDNHANFVPLETMLNACRAAAKIPMRTNIIMVELVADRTITRKTIVTHPIFKKIRSDFPNSRVKVKESPWMPLSPQKTSVYPEGIATTRQNLPIRTGCTSCLGTTTLQADGQIAACCGIGMRIIPELHVGHISRTTIAEADALMENDFLKRWIRVEGPEKILAWAASHDPEIKWEGMYAHHCQACVRLYKDARVRKVIVEHHKERMADVIMSEWLLFHYDINSVEPFRASSGEVHQSFGGEGAPQS